MAGEGLRRLALRRPELQRPIQTGRGHGAIRQKTDESNAVAMPFERPHMLAIGDIPQLDGIIEACGGQSASVPGKRGPVDSIVVGKRSPEYETSRWFLSAPNEKCGGKTQHAGNQGVN